MRTIGRNVAVGCGSVGLLLMVACSSVSDRREPEGSLTEEVRSGNRSQHGARDEGRHNHHGRGHRHGPRCRHDHDGDPGSGASSGAGGMGTGAATGSGGSGKGGGAGSGSSTGGAGGTSAGGGGGFAGGFGGTFTGGAGGAGGAPDPGVCGDGVPSFLEQCDDGNLTAGDGCNDACEIEAGFACEWGGTCHEVVCGDSVQDFYYAVGGGVFDYEECDDGNALAGDGCSDVCDLETGFVCEAPGLPCREVICGDGFQDGYFIPGDGGSGGTGMGGSDGGTTGGTGGVGGAMAGAGGGGSPGTYFFEACDDGNVTPGDGCSTACGIEDGFICDSPGEPCRRPRCGDGFVDFIPGSGGSGGAGGAGGMGGMGGSGTFEQCDDGNSNVDDGCDAACTIEPGFACWEPGMPCREIVCGDGLADWPDEQCDDGNDTPNDGCTDCTLDGGFGGSGGMGTGGSFFAGAGPMGGFGSGGSGTGG